MKRLSLPNYVSRTGAMFESSEKFLSSISVVHSAEDELKTAGVPLTRVDDSTFAVSKEELHCFIIGDSGCGKTRRVILPTIRLLSKARESMVISDPKGELYRTTSGSLRKLGYNVQVLNFRNPARGNCWNPLGQIDELYRRGDRDAKDKSLMMLNDIVNVLQQDLQGKDPFWAMAAADVMRGVSLFILEYGRSGDLTFENIANTARAIRRHIAMKNSGDENKARDAMQSVTGRILENIPDDSPIMQNLSVIITNADSTRNCIMAEFEAMISLYSSQESLMDLFSMSEIDISSIGREPSALFFILPDDTEALYPIATVFVKQIYSSLVALADEQKDGRLPNKVTFLLDEFANFARMPSIESMLTAARSRGIRFVLVCQSMDQLTSKYSESGRETLLANCRTWIYMSCRNLPFLERLERLAGYYTSPYTGEKCPLIDVGELQHFDVGQVLVLNDRCRPVIGYLPDYSKYDFGADGGDAAADLPPAHEPVSRQKFDIKHAYAVQLQRRQETAEPAADGRSDDVSALRAAILDKIAKHNSDDGGDYPDDTYDVPAYWGEYYGDFDYPDDDSDDRHDYIDAPDDIEDIPYEPDDPDDDIEDIPDETDDPDDDIEDIPDETEDSNNIGNKAPVHKGREKVHSAGRARESFIFYGDDDESSADNGELLRDDSDNGAEDTYSRREDEISAETRDKIRELKEKIARNLGRKADSDDDE